MPQGVTSGYPKHRLVWVLGFVCVGKAVHASNCAKGDQLHFPLTGSSSSSSTKDAASPTVARCKRPPPAVAAESRRRAFQRYKVNLDAYAMVLRCDGGHDRVFERTRALPLFMALTRAWRSPRPRHGPASHRPRNVQSSGSRRLCKRRLVRVWPVHTAPRVKALRSPLGGTAYANAGNSLQTGQSVASYRARWRRSGMQVRVIDRQTFGGGGVEVFIGGNESDELRPPPMYMSLTASSG